MAKSISGIFVGASGALEQSGGGVQQATREYITVLQAAGWHLEILPFDVRATLFARIRNRVWPRVMLVQMPKGLPQKVEHKIRAAKSEFVFFCPNVFPELSRHLRERVPNVQQVLLSVGVESIDFCVEQQLRRRNGGQNRGRSRAHRLLGEQLISEAQQRSLIDAVLTMSPLELEVEKWLGAPRVLWLPRTIRELPLVPQLVDGRVGCVSTLNHPPNLDGLTRVLGELATNVPKDFRFRLIGGPEELGRRLAQRFAFVDYLGRLDDSALRAEAATWCCFVHPLFVYAKGSSTKLAVALGWHLPVATTEWGARGYYWDETLVPLAKDPAQLARYVRRFGRLEEHENWRKRSIEIANKTPTIEKIATEIRQFLLADRC